MAESNWIPTVCHQCKAECPILVLFEDGVLKEIKANPKREGKVCPKGMAGISLQYNSDRLKHPLKRVGERGENKFEKISWNEAYDIISKKFNGDKWKALIQSDELTKEHQQNQNLEKEEFGATKIQEASDPGSTTLNTP